MSTTSTETSAGRHGFHAEILFISLAALLLEIASTRVIAG
jgi:hypothetical protein